MSRRGMVAREVWRFGPVTAVRYGRVVTVYLPAGSMIPGAKLGTSAKAATLPGGWMPYSPVTTVSFDLVGNFRAHAYVEQDGDVMVTVGRMGGTATDGGVTLSTSMSLTYVC